MSDEQKTPRIGLGLDFLALVAVANLRGEGYALTIQDELKELADKEVSLGALYNSLERLEEKGFIRGTKESTPSAIRGGKRRILYEVTGVGQAAIQDALAEQERVRVRVGGIAGLRPAGALSGIAGFFGLLTSHSIIWGRR